MIPITKTSLKMNNVDITYFIGKLKCTREQDSVIYSRWSEVTLGVLTKEMKRLLEMDE